MLVQEMHIDFDIKLQKVNSNAVDTFLPDEKDWLLNMAQYRFIRKHGVRTLNRRREGGEDSLTRYEDFNYLLKRVELPTIINTQDNYVYSVLPYDFFDYRNGKTKTYYNCSGINANVLNNINYIAEVLFGDSSATPDKFVGFEISIVRDIATTPVYTSIFKASDYNFNFGNTFVSNEEKFVLVNHVLEIVNRRSDVSVRWENYGNIYSSGSFVFITDDSTIDAIRISFDGNDDDILMTNNPFDSYADVSDVIVKNPSALRLVETEELFDILNHPYAKTIYDSPITTLRNGQIQVYHDDKFVLNTISIDYIKKPRLISLSLNQSCEIAESRHDVIVDIAVQLASAYTGSDVHKLIINENLLNE